MRDSLSKDESAKSYPKKGTKKSQVAALCYRGAPDGHGEFDVLMITSRGTGRWIIPKGWLMNDKTAAQSALQEAWEEAGVNAGQVSTAPIGYYHYPKRKKSGKIRELRVAVYAAAQIELAEVFPELGQRKITWMPAGEAAKLVAEPELQEILSNLPTYLNGVEFSE